MGQSMTDDLLTRLAEVDKQLDEALAEENVQIRNKRGVEIHSKLRKLKGEFDAIPDADPDKNQVNEAFIPVAQKLLKGIFDINPEEV